MPQKNTGILAAKILGTANDELGKMIVTYMESLKNEVLAKVEHLQSGGYPNAFDSK